MKKKTVINIITFLFVISIVVSGIICCILGLAPDKVQPDLGCRIVLSFCGFLNVIFVIGYILSRKDS